MLWVYPKLYCPKRFYRVPGLCLGTLGLRLCRFISEAESPECIPNAKHWNEGQPTHSPAPPRPGLLQKHHLRLHATIQVEVVNNWHAGVQFQGGYVFFLQVIQHHNDGTQGIAVG